MSEENDTNNDDSDHWISLPVVSVIVDGQELPELRLQPDGAASLETYVVQPDSEDAVAYQLQVRSYSLEDRWLEVYIDGQWATNWHLVADSEDLIEGWHVGTTMEESIMSYKVRPFLFAKPLIVEEAQPLPAEETMKIQGTIAIHVYDVRREESSFHPAVWENHASGSSPQVIGESHKTKKKDELFRGFTDLGDAVLDCPESLEVGESCGWPRQTQLLKGHNKLGIVQLHYDTNSSLMVRGVSPDALGLKVNAADDVKLDTDVARAQRRSLALLEQQRRSFVETCDLTAEDEECEVWVKRRRTNNVDHGGELD